MQSAKLQKDLYSLDEGVAMVKSSASAKFDESIELHVKLGIDPKKSEQTVRGTCILPHGTGKKLKIAVFTESKTNEAKEAGAELIGGKELVEEIGKTSKIAFDVALATPDFMRELSKIAKLLGPKGLMPSPKIGTLTDDLAGSIKNLKSGQVSFRNDNTGNVHQIIGKASWDSAKLKENAAALLSQVKKLRPKGIKGSFIERATLSSTMGPGIPISTTA